MVFHRDRDNVRASQDFLSHNAHLCMSVSEERDVVQSDDDDEALF